MLSDSGSIASLIGVLVSLFGLGFAILQILKLRGETRAAREAAEETRRAVDRETTSISLARVNERIEGLKDLHRQGEWKRALDRYPEIRRMLINIRVRHPVMSEEKRAAIQNVVTSLGRMESNIERSRDSVSQTAAERFNRELYKSQLALTELESELQQSI